MEVVRNQASTAVECGVRGASGTCRYAARWLRGGWGGTESHRAHGDYMASAVQEGVAIIRFGQTSIWQLPTLQLVVPVGRARVIYRVVMWSAWCLWHLQIRSPLVARGAGRDRNPQGTWRLRSVRVPVSALGRLRKDTTLTNRGPR
jgi:hypothetical protein